MRWSVLLLVLFALVACSKDDKGPEPLCIEVPETTISIEDSLQLIGCDERQLSIQIKGELARYSLPNRDTIYLHFDTLGSFILIYQQGRTLPASGVYYELPIQVE